MVQEFKAQPVILNISAAEPNAINDAVREIMESRIKTFNPFRRERIPEWNINIAYLCGYQNIGYNGINITLMPNTSLFSIVVNKIGPAVRNDVAMATKVPPKFDIVPDTTDENDRQTAIAGEKMSGYLRRINDFDKSRGKIIIWYDIAGIAWRKQYWDAQYKMIGLNPGPDEPNHNPDIEVGEPIYQGEAISAHTPTNEMIWDWRADTERLPWAIHAQPRSYGDLLSNFPDTAPLIPDSAFLDPNAGMNEFEIKVFNDFRQLANTGGSKTRPDSSQMGKRDKEVMVYEFWQVADSNYPVGVLATMAGMDPGTVLSNEPYPIESYPHGEVPFTAYDMMVPDKSVTGRASRISQARPIQREFNDIRSLIRENTATLGPGVMYIRRDSQVNLARLDNGSGLIIEYDGQRPHREQGIAVSNNLFVYSREIVGDINDIFSFPQVSQGKRPQGGPKSGVGIALLQESAVTQHSPIINEMDRRDERAMNQLLSVAYANYGERTFEIFGKDNEWIGFEFDPNSHSSKFNVVVRSGSSLPISKALEQDTVLGLLDRGLLGNPNSPIVKKRVLEKLSIGGLDNILKDKNKDVNFAKKEFQVPVQQYQQMMQQSGLQIPSDEILDAIFIPAPTPFDDHEVHIIEHGDDLKAKYYKYIGTNDPGMMQIAKAMMEHYAEQSRILSEIQLQQAIMTGVIKREDLESSQEKGSAKESSSNES